MPAPFARTLRALDADNPRRTWAGMLLAVVLLALWLAWLFLAPLPVIARSDSARVAEDMAGKPIILAGFPASLALTRLRPSQPARLTLDGLPGNLPAQVVTVDDLPREGHIQVVLSLTDEPAALRPGMTGTVEIETDRLTPAALLLRAIGQAR